MKPTVVRLRKALVKTKRFFLRAGRYSRKDVAQHHRRLRAQYRQGMIANRGLNPSAAVVAANKLHRQRLLGSDLRKKYG